MTHTQTHYRRSSRFGVTLVEIVVAVSLIGIMAAVAAPRIGQRVSYHQAASAAERIAADFNLARRHAKSVGSDETVSFDLTNHRYTLSSVTSLSHPTAVYTVELNEFPYDCTIFSANFGGGATVTFNAFGLPDNGGQIIVNAGTEQRTVDLDAGSGKASVL